MSKCFFSGVLLLALMSAVMPQAAGAAQLFFSAKATDVAVEESVEVGLFIVTESAPINAIEGKVLYPADLWEIQNVNEGDSIISFWIQRPKIESGSISFAGIVPGGFDGEQGLIFSLYVKPKRAGEGSFSLDQIKVLLHDGTGAEAPLVAKAFPLKAEYQGSVQQPVQKRDAVLPEVFFPEIARDPDMFDGKWFLAFTTQDKDSGIHHYEVCEGKRCSMAESPYVLQVQKLDQDIVVKAFDKSGNVRLAELPAKHPPKWFEKWPFRVILGALVFLAAFCGWAIKRKWRGTDR